MQYKLINIPNLKEVSADLYRAVPWVNRRQTVFNVLPKEYFEELNSVRSAVELIKPWSEVAGVCVITTMPNDHTPIHVDGNGTKKDGFGFNIPVHNCEDCYTVVYDVKGSATPSDPFSTPTFGHPYQIFEPEEVVEVDRLYYKDCGFLINTDKPHKVVNPTDKPRIVASFRFLTKVEL